MYVYVYVYESDVICFFLPVKYFFAQGCGLMKIDLELHIPSADPEGEPGVRNPPPHPEIWQRWVLCEYLMGRRSKGCFYLICINFFGSLRSPILYIMKIFEKSESLPSSKGLSLLPSYTLPLSYMKVPFPCLFWQKLHDFTQCKPKNAGRGPTEPHPPHLWHHLYILQSLHV